MARRISLIVRGVVYAAGFFFITAWLFPSLMNIRASTEFALESPLRALGIAPLLVGAAVVGWCFINFVTIGQGTPAPFDAPRQLVVTGPYQYLRNPMYIGGLLFLIGLAALFAKFSMALLWYALALTVGINLFVLFYEEPTLHRKFNGDYEQYCRNVRSWLPRLHPWKADKSAMAKAG